MATAPIFDWGQISKALAGGRSAALVGAGTGAAATWAVSQWVPDRLIEQVPLWVYLVMGAGPAVIGYLIGFIDVYFAKANTDALVVIPVATIQPPPDVVVVQPGEPVPTPKPGEIVAMMPPATETVVVTKPKDGDVAATMTDEPKASKKEK